MKKPDVRLNARTTPELLAKLKVKTAMEGTTITDVINKWAAEYVKDVKLSKVATKDK